MKRTWDRKRVGMVALCCGFGLVVADLSVAQQPAAQQLTQQRQQAQRQTGEKQFCLATEVIGMNVKAKGEEDVGQIRNLIINADGTVQYLALSTGANESASAARDARTPQAEILQTDRSEAAQADRAGEDRSKSASGNLTLVPWKLAKFHAGATSSQNFVAVDIEKDRLINAPSFTEQQLTARQGQMRVTAQVDQFFNVREQRGAARPDLDSDKQNDESPRGIPPQRDEN